MISAVILGAGISSRFIRNKLFEEINNELLIDKTISKFFNHKEINEIIVVLNNVNKKIFLNKSKLKKTLIKIVISEKKYRAESSMIGVKEAKNNYVMIHDASRPFVSQNIIKKGIKNISKYDAAIPILKISSSLKTIDSKNNIKTLDREKYFITQTPQFFNKKILLECFAKSSNLMEHDDLEIIEKFSNNIFLYEGSMKNIKITYPDDLKYIYE